MQRLPTPAVHKAIIRKVLLTFTLCKTTNFENLQFAVALFSYLHFRAFDRQSDLFPWPEGCRKGIGDSWQVAGIRGCNRAGGVWFVLCVGVVMAAWRP